MRRQLALPVVAALALVVPTAGPAATATGQPWSGSAAPAPPAGPSPATLAAAPAATIVFGRSLWAQTDPRCNVHPQAVTLEEVARDLAARRLTATGVVVVDRTRERQRLCWRNFVRHTSWADLARLRDRYGWTFVSGGNEKVDMRDLPPWRVRQETCGSLPAFTSRGHDRAWGLFAYGNNSFSPRLQRTVVGECFAFGRTYRGGVNTPARVEGWGGLQGTHSVNGGRCADRSRPCSRVTVKPKPRTYRSPADLRRLFAGVRQGQWVSVQFYRLVRGASTGRDFSWDCRSPDWRDHWTSSGEIYCYADFLRAVDGIRPWTVADPATVAERWGRVP